jgi:hypothetical protein
VCLSWCEHLSTEYSVGKRRNDTSMVVPGDFRDSPGTDSFFVHGFCVRIYFPYFSFITFAKMLST